MRAARPEPDQTLPDVGAAVHPIAVVAARTGLSRDVIRVWERRYGAVEPVRTPGGHRLYTDEDVHRFRLLAAATEHGRSISALAQLGTDELARIAAGDLAVAPRAAAGSESSVTRDVDAAIKAIVALDGASLDALLRRQIAREGVPWFLEQAVPALMQTVGDNWAAGQLTVAQEHLASAVVVSIILETVRAAPAAPSAPRLVVATPSGERHAVGAALSAAAASVDGWSIVYLGADVPDADIAAAADATDARAVALSIVYLEDRARTMAEVHGLRDKLRAGVPLFIGGAAASGIAADIPDRGVIVCESVSQWRSELAREALRR